MLFLDGFGQSFIFPILTQTLTSPETSLLAPGWSFSSRDILYSYIVGVFYISWMLGAAVLGDLSDSYGRKKVLLVCILGMTLGTVLTAVAFSINNLSLMIVGRIIVGITAGSQAIAQAAIADISLPEHQARNTGYILMAVTLGVILGPIYGKFFSDPLIFSWFSNQTLFIGVSIMSVLSMVILMVFYQDKIEPNYKPVKLTRIFDIFHDAFRHENIRVLMLASFGLFGCWSIYYFYMTIYLVKYFPSNHLIVTLFMSMYGIGAAIGMAFLPGVVEKRCSLKQAVIGGWGLMALIFIATQLSPWLLLDCILAVFAGMGIGIGFLFTMKAFSLHAPADKQGWIMGIFNATWVAILGLTVMVTGYISAFGLAVPFFVAYALFVFGALVFIFKVTLKPAMTVVVE